MKTHGLVATLVVFLATGACGGDDDNGVDSGVDPAKPLDMLTDEEAVDLCEAALEATTDEDLKIIACYGFAIALTEEAPETDCEMEAQDCIAEPDDPGPEDPCANATAAALPECASEVTVGEFEDCTGATA